MLEEVVGASGGPPAATKSPLGRYRPAPTSLKTIEERFTSGDPTPSGMVIVAAVGLLDDEVAKLNN